MHVTTAKNLFQSSPKSRITLLGNEAIARGALEAGVEVVAGYPGTPSSEVIETLAQITPELPQLKVQWSANEKVAFEIAYAASICGLRAMTVMKHVGVNVALDSLASATLAGIKGGCILVSADDPGMWSSQNEQDNRFLANHLLIPCIEPSTVQEAKDLTKFAFDFSEKSQSIVMLRSTTRLSHSRGVVCLGDLPKMDRRPYFDYTPENWVAIPSIARQWRERQLKRLQKIQHAINNLPFNEITTQGDGTYGIVATGLAYPIVREVLEKLRLDHVALCKIVTPFPPPETLLQEFLEQVETVLVVEELEPFFENQVKRIAHEQQQQVIIRGKDLIPRIGELTPQTVSTGIAKFLDISIKVTKEFPNPPPIFKRYPALCPGCMHRPVFYALKTLKSELQEQLIVSGDIGCYTLGVYKPYELLHTCLSMGSSIGLAQGLAQAVNDPVVAVIGDSTFFHAGLSSLANAVYNRSNITILVLDNITTAMTGFQPNPGTGITATGQEGVQILIENVARGLHVQFVEVVNPYNLQELRKVIKDAIAFKGPAVVVVRAPCILVERKTINQGQIVPIAIDSDKCNSCMLCVSQFGCPAIIPDHANMIQIVAERCPGAILCGACLEICPENAILERHSENE